jgi:hypothetical protein
MPPRHSALELVSQAQRELLGIRHRCTTLTAFEAELNRVTRGEPFTIMNELVWTTMFDARDMLVIHFAQWVLSASGDGGLFGKLRQCRLRDFYVRKSYRPDPDRKPLTTPGADKQRKIEEGLDRADHARWRTLFEKVFPDAVDRGGCPNHDDLAKLEELFDAELGSVVEDRNQNRAHPHYGPAPKKGAAKMLDFSEQRSRLEWADGFLNDLRILLDRSQWCPSEPTSEAESSAEDLVDLVLFGSRRRMDLLSGLSEAAKSGSDKFGCQYRDGLYEAMWSQRRITDEPFNDPAQLEGRESYRLFTD